MHDGESDFCPGGLASDKYTCTSRSGIVSEMGPVLKVVAEQN